MTIEIQPPEGVGSMDERKLFAEPRERIIVALDMDSLDEAKRFVGSIVRHVGLFKVGLQLTTAAGAPQVVEAIHALGGQVFYDGKFCDIPNTVGAAAKAVAGLGVKMFNVHASAGIEAMKAAVANKGDSLVLAVTVLTSLNAMDIYDIGYPSQWPCVKGYTHYHSWDLDGGGYIHPLVGRMACCASRAGCDGVICSPKELQFLNRSFNEPLPHLLKVTPGVRPKWAAAGDQKRVMTPGEAIRAGADYLVIGRPITRPPAGIGTPVDAAKHIAEEIEEALSASK